MPINDQDTTGGKKSERGGHAAAARLALEVELRRQRWRARRGRRPGRGPAEPPRGARGR